MNNKIVIIAQCREINRYHSHFDKDWKFVAVFSSYEKYNAYVDETRKLLRNLEFNCIETEVV